MTYQNNFTLSEALLEQLTSGGLEALPALFQVLLNAAMQIERQNHLGAAPHQRTQERTVHANGFKDKPLAGASGAVLRGLCIEACGVPGREVARRLDCVLVS